MNEARRPRADLSARAEAMVGSLRAAGLRLTPQRVAVVRQLAVDESHPTAQELFDRLRAALPTMSFATVYNTLDALRRARLCSGLALSPGSARFDPNVSPHDHLVCDRCGAVRDVPQPAPQGPSASHHPLVEPHKPLARWAPGFRLRAVERVFRGLCEGCTDAASPAARQADKASLRARGASSRGPRLASASSPAPTETKHKFSLRHL